MHWVALSMVSVLLTGCAGHPLKKVNANEFIMMIERPNGQCPGIEVEQGILNSHPEGDVVVTYSEKTGGTSSQTATIIVRPGKSSYLGCKTLPSGNEADRKIVDAHFE